MSCENGCRKPKHMSTEEIIAEVRNGAKTLSNSNQSIFFDGGCVVQNVPSIETECCTPKSSKIAQHELRLAEHKQICDYLHDLYDRKNRDYGSSVTDTFDKYGLVSFLVRLEDKLNRVRALTQNGEARVLDEKIEDTLMDMANYAMLAVIELRMQGK